MQYLKNRLAVKDYIALYLL